MSAVGLVHHSDYDSTMHDVGSMLEPFSWHHLNQWQISALPITLLVASLLWYFSALRLVPNWPKWRQVWFLLATLTVFVATQSVIGVYDMELFSSHMIQHLLLVMVAGPLYALSAPLDLLRASSPRSVRVLDSRPVQIVLHPVFGFALYAAFIPATHLSVLFDWMLRYTWFHHSEQIAFIFVGYLFFRHAVGIESGMTLHPGLRLVYVMAAVPVDTITGLALAMSSHNPFPTYDTMMRMSTMPVLQDLHLGGAIMWIGGDGLMLLMLFPIVVKWVKYETQKTKEIDAELDRLGL